MSASSKKKLRKEQNAAQLTEKQLTEQKEAKKLKNYTLTFLVVMAVVLVLAIATISVTAITNSGIRERNTDALTVGEHTLSNAELNYFYMDAINRTYNEWYEQYGDYTDMYISWIFGLDVTTPLNEQAYDEEQTYAEYFTDMAVEDAKEIYAVYDAALAAGHTRTEEEIADVSETIEAMQAYASLNGVSYGQYLKAVYGNGAKADTFNNYLDILSVVSSYQAKYHDGLTYDAAALSAYNKEHFNEFSSFSYTSFFVDADKFLTGGTTDEDGNTTYSDDEKAAALKAAEEAAKAIVASGADTAEKLDAAIKEQEKYKNDSSAKSTKSEDSLYTSINENIAQWLAEDDRKAGDITYLTYTTTETDADGNEAEVEAGFHVIIMGQRNDNTQQLVNVRHILIKPTANTVNEEDGTKYSSDEEWAEAKKKLEAIRDEWLAGEKTEDSFAKLATEKTEDGGSKETGGLYEDVTPGSMVEEFDAWIFDAARKAGDYEIVKTEYGYHLIYFVSTSDESYRDHMMENAMREEDYTKWHDGIVDAATATVLDTSLLELDLILANN